MTNLWCVVILFSAVSLPAAGQDPCSSDVQTLYRAEYRQTDLEPVGNDVLCDKNRILQGSWYRVSDNNDERLPERCVDNWRCGTQHPIWLNGTHPLGDVITTVTVCMNEQYVSGCCNRPQQAQVKRCGSPQSYFYIYQLPDPEICSSAYCAEVYGTTTTLPIVASTTTTTPASATQESATKMLSAPTANTPVPTTLLSTLLSKTSTKTTEATNPQLGLTPGPEASPTTIKTTDPRTLKQTAGPSLNPSGGAVDNPGVSVVDPMTSTTKAPLGVKTSSGNDTVKIAVSVVGVLVTVVGVGAVITKLYQKRRTKKDYGEPTRKENRGQEPVIDDGEPTRKENRGQEQVIDDTLPMVTPGPTIGIEQVPEINSSDIEVGTSQPAQPITSIETPTSSHAEEGYLVPKQWTQGSSVQMMESAPDVPEDTPRRMAVLTPTTSAQDDHSSDTLHDNNGHRHESDVASVQQEPSVSQGDQGQPTDDSQEIDRLDTTQQIDNAQQKDLSQQKDPSQPQDPTCNVEIEMQTLHYESLIGVNDPQLPSNVYAGLPPQLRAT